MKLSARCFTLSPFIALTLLITGCVTINIYFPASAAEKAADKIIDEVWQLRGEAGAPAGAKTEAPAAAPTPPANDKTEKP